MVHLISILIWLTAGPGAFATEVWPGPVVYEADEGTATPPAPDADWMQLRDQGDGEFLLITSEYDHLPMRAGISGRNPARRRLNLTARRARRGEVKVIIDHGGLATLTWRDDLGRARRRVFRGEFELNAHAQVFTKRFAPYPAVRPRVIDELKNACANLLTRLGKTQRSSRR